MSHFATRWRGCDFPGRDVTTVEQTSQRFVVLDFGANSNRGTSGLASRTSLCMHRLETRGSRLAGASCRGEQRSRASVVSGKANGSRKTKGLIVCPLACSFCVDMSGTHSQACFHFLKIVRSSVLSFFIGQTTSFPSFNFRVTSERVWET